MSPLAAEPAPPAGKPAEMGEPEILIPASLGGTTFSYFTPGKASVPNLRKQRRAEGIAAAKTRGVW